MNIRLTLTLLLTAAVWIGCEETETPPEREVAQTQPQVPPAEPRSSTAEAGQETDVTPMEAGQPSAVDREEDPTATGTPPATADPRTAEFGDFRAPKPVSWIWQPPQSTMRLANYVVPGRDGSDQAELAIFHGIGGSRDENVTRWVNQFRSPEGGVVEPEITMHEADGMQVTVIELSGEYMGMGQQWYTEDQTMLAAILQAPEGDIHIKLTGPRETVEANREAFIDFVNGIKQSG